MPAKTSTPLRNEKPETPYHSPDSVDDITEKNVKAIAELDNEAKSQDSKTDRVASAITRFCGSMPFVWIHVVWFTIWIIANTVFLSKPIDPYPFSFLTLVVSLEAIFLSTFIMIAENRQERIAERRSHLDLQINLLAEQENTKTLELLEKIANKLGVDPTEDPEVEVLEQATQPEKLAKQIDESITESERKDEHSS